MRRRPVRLNYTDEMEIPVPPEPNHRTEAKWKQRLAFLLRYVDDEVSLAKINFENSLGFTISGQKHRIKHAAQSQNEFRHLVRNAEKIGMKVNAAKTTLVCFSDALAYSPDAYIEDADGNVIRGQPTMKALGVRFSNRPDWKEHVAWIRKSFRARLWILRNLKKSGFNADELVHVYQSMLRPVAEYACVVFHSGLTDEQDEQIELLQNQALKCIYGPFISARKMREKAGILSLRARRIELCDMFVKKNSPESLNDLRNISCTMLASKIYESYVLDWVKSEVTLRSNQYGGVQGVGTDHILVEMWQGVLQDLEDYGAATVITSVDYSKAFNRMSYQYCLQALARNGASTNLLKLIATFLTDSTMTVKVGQTMSTPLPVSGGCPL